MATLNPLGNLLSMLKMKKKKQTECQKASRMYFSIGKFQCEMCGIPVKKSMCVFQFFFSTLILKCS